MTNQQMPFDEVLEKIKSRERKRDGQSCRERVVELVYKGVKRGRERERKRES